LFVGRASGVFIAVINIRFSLCPQSAAGRGIQGYSQLRELLAAEGEALPAGAPIPTHLQLNFFRLFSRLLLFFLAGSENKCCFLQFLCYIE